MTFDPAKPVMTRDGRRARVICTDRKGPGSDPYCIIALVHDRISGEVPQTYTRDGLWNGGSNGNADLVNVERIKVEVDVWRDKDTSDVLTRPPIDRKWLTRQLGRYELLATKTIEFDHPATPPD